MISLLRIEEHKMLAGLDLDGKILDLGGVKDAEYQKIIYGSHSFYVANMDAKTIPDKFVNLEKPLPFNDAEFDHVLLINVLEHIFEYRSLLKESIRAIKTNGSVTIIVPFLFPFHASPGDFHRLTASALQKELELVGCKDIRISSLGSGVFASRFLLLDRLMPWPVRFLNYMITRHIVTMLDKAMFFMSKIFRKTYKKDDYALGYFVHAIKK